MRVVVDVSTTCIICIALMKIAETKAANNGALGDWIAEHLPSLRLQCPGRRER